MLASRLTASKGTTASASGSGSASATGTTNDKKRERDSPAAAKEDGRKRTTLERRRKDSTATPTPTPTPAPTGPPVLDDASNKTTPSVPQTSEEHHEDGEARTKKADDTGLTEEDFVVPAFQTVSETTVTTLTRHSKQVFACQWNPTGSGALASVAADGLGIIWDGVGLQPLDADGLESKDLGPKESPEGSSKGTPMQTSTGSQRLTHVLDHRVTGEDLDVTTLEWNRDGSLLATGDYVGNAYIWDACGRQVHALRKHGQAIFTIKWNARGNYLLTGSHDESVVLWDGSTGEAKQVFSHHRGPVLDVAWKTNTVFASCSSDKTILLCKLHERAPLRTLTGHTADINAIRWDAAALRLASCSDDHLVKLWDVEQDSAVATLRGHRKPVYTLDWSPTGPKSANPGLDVRLASASYDDEARVWSAATGQCLFTLTGHANYIYAIAYSPDAQFIATGSIDKTVKIWSAKDGSLVRHYVAEAGVYDLSWSPDSQLLAICTRNNDLKILHFKY